MSHFKSKVLSSTRSFQIIFIVILDYLREKSNLFIYTIVETRLRGFFDKLDDYTTS